MQGDSQSLFRMTAETLNDNFYLADLSSPGAKKRGLVVAKKLVVNDFWLVVNGDRLVVKSHNKYSMHASCIIENYSYMCCAHL